MTHAADRSLLRAPLHALCLGGALLLLPACGDSGGGTDSEGDSDPSAGGETGAADSVPPTDGDALLAWLEAGEYLGWHAETAPHDSAGPHFGTVRTYVNQQLFDSLEAGDATHPVDAAAVKELYGSGDAVLGWAVEVKTQADSADGDGWYWYEKFNDQMFADGEGASLCTDCHVGGADYVLTPFPLQ